MSAGSFRVKSIIVVGGGTAGWLSASFFATQLPGVKVTVIESDQEKIIGVGETTVPQIRHHLAKMGLDEDTWMRDTGAVFKYGARLLGWRNGSDERIHGFSDAQPAKVFSHSPYEYNKKSLQHELDTELDLDYWIHMLKTGVISPDDSHMMGTEAWHHIKYNRAHRDLEGHQYFSRIPGHAYNLDAFKFGKTLRNLVAEPNGVQRIVGHIKEVLFNDDQSVAGLIDTNDQLHKADLYIDSTGFKRLLIGKYSPWRSKKKLLGEKAVVAGRVQYNDDQEKWCIPSLNSTALSNGWSWMIPLRDDMGSGYVYDTRYTDADTAEAEFRKHWENAGKEVDIKVRVKFDSGANEYSAYRNVVAVGLANNFLEPLEATSISFSALVNELVVDVLKKHDGHWSYRDADIVSRLMHREIDYSADFLWSHYGLTQRQDTEFWRDQHLRNDEAKEIVYKWFMSGVDIYRREKDFGHTRYNKFDWALMITTMQAWDDCPARVNINPAWVDRAKLFYNFKNNMAKETMKLVPTHWELIKHINKM